MILQSSPGDHRLTMLLAWSEIQVVVREGMCQALAHHHVSKHLPTPTWSLLAIGAGSGARPSPSKASEIQV